MKSSNNSSSFNKSFDQNKSSLFKSGMSSTSALNHDFWVEPSKSSVLDPTYLQKSFHYNEDNLLDEKELKIQDLQKQLDKERVTRVIAGEGKDELIYELQKELEEAVEKAATALEEERAARQETERLLDKMSASYKDAMERLQKLEKEQEHQKNLEADLERERKKALETLLREREAWSKERQSFQDQLNAKVGDLLKLEMQNASTVKYQQIIAEQKSEIEALKARLQEISDAKSSVEAERDSLKRTLQSTEHSDEDRRKHISVLQHDNRVLAEKVKMLENEREAEQKRHSAQLMELQDQLGTLLIKTQEFETGMNNQLLELSDQLKTARDHNSDLTVQLTALQTKYKLLQDSKLQQENKEIQQELRRLQESSESMLKGRQDLSSSKTLNEVLNKYAQPSDGTQQKSSIIFESKSPSLDSMKYNAEPSVRTLPPPSQFLAAMRQERERELNNSRARSNSSMDPYWNYNYQQERMRNVEDNYYPPYPPSDFAPYQDDNFNAYLEHSPQHKESRRGHTNDAKSSADANKKKEGKKKEEKRGRSLTTSSSTKQDRDTKRSTSRGKGRPPFALRAATPLAPHKSTKSKTPINLHTSKINGKGLKSTRNFI